MNSSKIFDLLSEKEERLFLESFLSSFGYNESLGADFLIQFSPTENKGIVSAGYSILFKGPILRSIQEVEFAKSLIKKCGIEGISVEINE